MGDPPASSVNESTDAVLSAYIKHLPSLLSTTSAQIAPTERAKQAVSEEITPRTASLALKTLQDYGPAFARIGGDVNREARTSDVANEASILKTLGPDLANSYLNISKQIDPEFYSTRAKAGASTNSLLDSAKAMFGSGLTGGERAEIERAINLEGVGRGMTGITSPVNTIENAMTFGNAARNREFQAQDAMGKAINTATTFMQGGKSNFDPTQAALGRPSTNPGVNQFTGVQKSGDEAFSVGGNFLNNVTGMRQQQNQINSERRSGLDVMNQTIGSLPCCFIFLESYNGSLPLSVRYWRNVYYNLEPDIANGYKRMAKWLVPLMRKSSFIKSLVNDLMVMPLSQYAEFLSHKNNDGMKFEGFKKFWFTLWRYYGRTSK